jgi:rare lipoprotein A
MIRNFFLVCLALLIFNGCSSVSEFQPKPEPDQAPMFGEVMTGDGTWYGSLFHGRRMSNGIQFDMNKLTASHESYPLGSVVQVTNPENGKTVKVVITDRHNLNEKHQLSLSKKAAKLLEVYPKHTFPVKYMMVE